MAYFQDGPDLPATKRAVACALTMMRANDRLIRPILVASTIVPIAFRISIDYGPVTIARLGAAQRFNAYVAIGATANFASKMLAHAKPGEIRVGRVRSSTAIGRGAARADGGRDDRDRLDAPAVRHPVYPLSVHEPLGGVFNVTTDDTAPPVRPVRPPIEQSQGLPLVAPGLAPPEDSLAEAKTPSGPLAPSAEHLAFAQQTHDYVREYIRNANQKAAFLFAVSTGGLGYLLARNVSLGWVGPVRTAADYVSALARRRIGDRRNVFPDGLFFRASSHRTRELKSSSMRSPRTRTRSTTQRARWRPRRANSPGRNCGTSTT